MRSWLWCHHDIRVRLEGLAVGTTAYRADAVGAWR